MKALWKIQNATCFNRLLLTHTTGRKCEESVKGVLRHRFESFHSKLLPQQEHSIQSKTHSPSKCQQHPVPCPEFPAPLPNVGNPRPRYPHVDKHQSMSGKRIFFSTSRRLSLMTTENQSGLFRRVSLLSAAIFIQSVHTNTHPIVHSAD